MAARRCRSALRLTLGFALAMAVVLAAVGLVRLPPRRRTSCWRRSTRRSSRRRRRSWRTRTGIDLVDPDGATDARAALRRATAALLGVAAAGARAAARPRARAAARTRRYGCDEQIRLHGRRGEWRVLAVCRAARRRSPSSRARSRRASESLDHLRHELLVFLPLALLAASLGGYAARGRRRCVRSRRCGGARQAVTAGEPAALPVPPSDDEISRLAVDAQRHARAPPGRLRARAALRRRREPRAADAARPAADGARARAAAARARTRSSRRRSGRRPRRRTGWSRLAEDLLLIARADQGPLPIRREDVDADELLVGRRRPASPRGHGSSGARFDVETERAAPRRRPATGRAGARRTCVDNALVYGEGTVELRAVERRRPRRAARPSTRAAASRSSSARGRSTASAAPTRREAAAAPGWASRSSSWSRGLTAETWAYATSRQGGADVWISLPRAPTRAETLAGSRG